MKLDEHPYMPYYLAILTIAVLLVIASMNPPEEEGQRERRARYGSSVHVIYVGYFDNGLVFDTNDQYVNDHDDEYPKSLTYTHRENMKPLDFTIGSGRLLTDFELSVISLEPGDKVWVTIPPERGYGAIDDNLTVAVNITDRIPVFERMSLEVFNQTYPGTYDPADGAPSVNLSFRHYMYDWNVTVMSIDSAYFVTLMNSAKIGPMAGFPWSVEVININDDDNGTIIVEHFPSVGDSMADEFDKNDPWQPGTLKEAPGRVIEVTTETFTLNYNREVKGETLTFEIELIYIE